MALSIVRVISLTTSQINILFTDDLDPNIGVGNVAITALLDNIPDTTVISVSVENDVLTINFRPIFPKAQYRITFSSTTQQSFQTVNGEAIFEDGARNTLIIVSPGEDKSTVRDEILEAFPIVYESEQPSLIRDLTSVISDQFQIGRDTVDTVRAANYISVLVENESMTRNDGPTDKFKNGGVYEILRVAPSITSVPTAGSIQFDAAREASFTTTSTVLVNPVISTLPADPISLQTIDVVREEISDDINQENFFSGLRIKVSKRPIVQVISVSLVRNGQTTEYDIDEFGYTLKDNRYDTTTASKDINLTDQEIDLSSSSITGASGGFIQPRPGDTMYVSYVYKKLGRDIDSSTVVLSTVKNAVRETTPALLNVFSLDNAPIVTASDQIPTTGGVSFLNATAQNGSAPFTVTHSAFTREIEFDQLKIPNRPGDFSVNYNTGEVYVFGETTDGDGTGLSPPVANYSYRQVFTSGLDYTFDSDIDEISARSTRNISGIEAKVSFDYEDVFATGEDFRFLSHVEALNERVNNKLTDTFTVSTSNSPVTDVFRIFNETTGEIYSLDRFNDTSIFFTGRQAPKQVDVSRERAVFSREPQEVLLIADELSNTIGLLVFKINLANAGITDTQRNFIGASYDTSVLFSRTDIFARERFYEDRLFTSVSQNLDRMTAIGDYMIDYNNGIIYVAVSSSQSSDLGDISYEYDDIETKKTHILGVNNIYRSANSLEENITNYTIGNITDTTANVTNLEQVGERFINNNATRPLLVGTYQSGEDGVTVSGDNLFTSNSAVFTADDIGRTLKLGSSGSPPSQDVTITGVVNTHMVTVSPVFSNTADGRVWVILDLSSGADKTITLGNNIVSVRNIYTVEQIGTLTSTQLAADGYFDINDDSFEDNVITLDDDNLLSVGDAVVVIYNYGNLYIDYKHLFDELLISYEYGENSLDWSISSTLAEDDEYFITYRYGALREPLLTNFGSLTQIPALTNFAPDFDREVYRSVVAGTLQSFVEGPTIPSIERLVESFTGVTPDITESVFEGWVVGRDFLHLKDIETDLTPTFDLGKFDNGISATTGQSIEVPASSHIRLDEGTIGTWLRPSWKGLENDSSVTFDLEINDVVVDPSRVFIGPNAVNPTEIPFTLNISGNISLLGMPNNIDSATGYFVWFDEFSNNWQIRWRENARQLHDFSGTLTTTGEFFNVVEPTLDGYEINEFNDLITSSTRAIEFTASIDCVDSYAESQGVIGSIDGGAFVDETFISIIDGGSFINDVFVCTIDGGSFINDAYEDNLTENVSAAIYAIDGISFMSGDEHYVFDMAYRQDSSRMSLYKDGTGFLNFRVFDNQTTLGRDAGFYNISTSIRNWGRNDLRHVAVSWQFNSADEQDFMHLFVDGQEVPTLFKYGGSPTANSLYDFGDVAEETIITSALRPIVNGFDGSTEAGSNLFISQSVNFDSSIILVGDSFKILDSTVDGSLDPVAGGVYTITGVGGNTVTLDRSLTLTLGNVSFAVNQHTETVDTNVNFQDFIVVAIDGYGNETELEGLSATTPDYSVARGSNATHIIYINNGVSISDRVVIRPLGLIFRRCKEKIYKYDDNNNTIRLMTPPPVELQDVDITKILIDRTLVEEGDLFILSGGMLSASLGADGYSADGYICQPSNQDNGRKLAVTLSGDNINYSGTDNRITINGDTFSGITQETLIFVENSTQVTSEDWLNITSVTVYVAPIDTTEYAGIFEIRENKPMNESENNGDFVEITDYSNGIFTLEIYGSGGIPYVLDACFYEIDYPSFLKINMDGPPETFFIGSDYLTNNEFDGIIDEFKILKEPLTDIRAGEPELTTSITNDYNADIASVDTADTLLLMHFDDDIDDSSVYRDSFDAGFEIADSVNTTFETALKIRENRPYEVSNALGVFNNDEGTIEFWVSPLNDNSGDPNLHYYIDMSPVLTEETTSSTSITVTSNQRIREIDSVRLAGDVDNTGTNYFSGGSISNVDGKTITLGIPLPSQETLVKIIYIPLNAQGDRVSVYKDGNGFINFFMKASGVEHLISTPVDWERHTWHRVMIMWRTNSANNNDRLRLFVDGNERGTIKYGTGLIYGTGVIWGQAEVRVGVNRFIVNNIDLTDTFSKIVIGTDTLGSNNARALLDNMRFSNIERLQSIKIVGNDTVDVNYTANTSLAQPIISDLYTTLLLDFDKEENVVEFFAELINQERGIYRFEVKVIDSFDRITGNTALEDLLTELIETIKPAHTESIVTFVE
jgi:hypothetical protein